MYDVAIGSEFGKPGPGEGVYFERHGQNINGR
jgi:hypothetical protein